MPDTPIVLVATKIDLREDPTQDVIATAEGKKMRDKIKAAKYIECSAKNMQGLTEVITEAVRSAVHKSSSKRGVTCSLI